MSGRVWAGNAACGKIMRRILRKIAETESGWLRDTSTLVEPAVVGNLIEDRMNR